jgi:hypothetical protein
MLFFLWGRIDMSKNANKRPDNPNIEKDDVTQGRKPNEVEERPQIVCEDRRKETKEKRRGHRYQHQIRPQETSNARTVPGALASASM